MSAAQAIERKKKRPSRAEKLVLEEGEIDSILDTSTDRPTREADQ